MENESIKIENFISHLMSK